MCFDTKTKYYDIFKLYFQGPSLNNESSCIISSCNFLLKSNFHVHCNYNEVKRWLKNLLRSGCFDAIIEVTNCHCITSRNIYIYKVLLHRNRIIISLSIDSYIATGKCSYSRFSG